MTLRKGNTSVNGLIRRHPTTNKLNIELILALPSGSHRKGFVGRRENRAEILLLKLNRRIEEFN